MRVQLRHLDGSKHLVVIRYQTDRRTGFLPFLVALEHRVQSRASEEGHRLQVDDDQPGRVRRRELQRGGQVSGELVDVAGVDIAFNAHHYSVPFAPLCSTANNSMPFARMRSMRRPRCPGRLTRIRPAAFAYRGGYPAGSAGIRSCTVSNKWSN